MAGEGFDPNSLVVAHRRAPRLDPHMHVAVAANSSSIEDAMTQAGAVAGFGGALKLRSGLEQQDDGVQWKYWLTAPQSTQDLLLQSGYRPPQIWGYGKGDGTPLPEHKKKSGGIGGWISDKVGTVASGVGAGLQYAAGLGAEAAGRTLHLATEPLAAVQHVYRAGMYLGDNPEKARTGWFGLEEIGHAWSETFDGKKTFSPYQEDVARRKYGDEVVKLAKRRASGVSDADLIDEIKDPNDKIVFADRLQHDDKLKEATAFMQAAHISYGRTVLDPSIAVDHPFLHRVVTGTADGWFDWSLDPIVVASKAHKSAEVGRYLIQGADDVERVFADPGKVGANVRREAEAVIDALTRNGDAAMPLRAGDLRALRPRWGNVADDLVQAKVDSVPKLIDWLKGEAGMDALLRGRVSGMQGAAHSVPYIGTGALAAGQMPIMEGGFATIPRLTAKGAVVESARNAIAGRLGEGEGFIIGRASRFAKTTVTLIPEGTMLSAKSRDSSVMVGRLARLLLPEQRARDVESMWAATRSVGMRRDIYSGLLEEMRVAGGIDAEGEFWQKIKASVGGVDHTGQTYSATGKDIVEMGEGFSREGFLKTHASSRWVMPSARELYQAAGKARALGLNQSEFLDKAMNAWRLSVIFRPAFALRAGGEEFAEFLMKAGAKRVGQTMLARSAIKPGEERLIPWHPLSSLYNAMIGTLPEEWEKAVDTPRKLMATYFGNNVRRAMRNVEGRLAGETYLNAAHRYAASEEAMRAFEQGGVSAVHPEGIMYLEPRYMGVQLMEGGVLAPAKMRATGKFTEMRLIDDIAHFGWRQNLDELGQDPVARAVMRRMLVHGDVEALPERYRMSPTKATDLGDPVVETIPAESLDEAWMHRREMLIDHATQELSKPVHADWRDSMFREFADRNGRRVGKLSKTARPIAHEIAAAAEAGNDVVPLLRGIRQHVPQDVVTEINSALRDATLIPDVVEHIKTLAGDITQEEAWRDWASLTVDHTLHVLSGDGRAFNKDIAQRILDGDVPTVEELIDMPLLSKPASVKVPNFIKVTEGEGRMRNLINKGFSETVGRPMNWLIREPLMMHNYAIAERDAEIWAEKMVWKNPAAKAEYIHDVAIQRAVDDSIPFIHDPRVRSQFAVTTRNLMPFWFAQEQFYKRVARTFAYNPAAFRQAQLIASGFRHIGVLHKDDKGDDYFFIPVIGQYVQEVTYKAMSMYYGMDSTKVPMPVGFSGELKMATPGLERLGVPSTAPWLGVLVGQIGQRFPELEPVAKGIEGDNKQRSPWEMVVPSSVARVYHALADDPDKSAQFMSAEVQVMQYLAHAGVEMPPEDDAKAQEIWREQIVNWTRSLLLTRAALGFVSPASPVAELDPNKMHKEFIDLIGEFGYNDGFAEFVKRHKGEDVTPYTIFPTKSASGGPLPVTRAAFNYIEKHRDLIDQFPAAAGWLLPTDPSKKSGYDANAYREQLALEMRTRMPSMEDAWKAIKFAQAKETYFATRDDRDRQLIAAGTDAARKQQIRKIWKNFSDNYMATHPIFAQQIKSPAGEDRRIEMLKQLRRATIDPRWPKDKQASHVKTMLDTYDDFKAHMDMVSQSAHPTSKAAKAAKERYKGVFLSWAHDYIDDNPDVDLFYKMVIEQDVDPNAGLED